MAVNLITWEAGSAIFPGTAPPQLKYTEGNFAWMGLAFDAATPEKCVFLGVMPPIYAGGTITVRLFWKANGATGNVVWGAKYAGVADGEVLDATLSTQATVTDTSSTATHLLIGSITLTTPTIVAGDLVVLEIQRVAGDASDTLAVDALLLAVELQE